MGLILSIYGVASTYLIGNKWKYAPMMQLIGQILWAYYAIWCVKDYGLLIGVGFYTAVYALNAWKWVKDEKTTRIKQ